jgi:hypothetical protein
MASSQNANEVRPAGGDVSHGNKDMEVTGDRDLDRARDHVLHGAMHGPGDKAFSDVKDGAGDGKLGGGDVSHGNTEVVHTGAQDLDRARDHVAGAGGNSSSDAKDGTGGKLGGGDVSGGKKDMEATGDADLDRAREHVLSGKP